MARVLYIGGTGEISFACVAASITAGHEVTVFNRGRRGEVPPGAIHIAGDIGDDRELSSLAARHFDVVCQFIAYSPAMIEKDIDAFRGHCGQYIFISTASAYQKPCPVDLITESLPLHNPFWTYSREKAACEQLLDEVDDLAVTIVRPSHTYRTRLPGTCLDGDHMAWRMRNGKPIIVHDDGESLWTLTHADDFARAFVALLANEDAVGEAFHITCDQAHTWNEIVEHVARVLDCRPEVVHVPTDVLVVYRPDWLGPLKGDKANSVVFDNRKIRAVAGGWRCEIGLSEGLHRAASFVSSRFSAGYLPDAELDALVDRIVSDPD